MLRLYLQTIPVTLRRPQRGRLEGRRPGAAHPSRLAALAPQDDGSRQERVRLGSNRHRASPRLVVRDARRCRAPHHEGLGPHPEERAFARVSKDEATELEKALVSHTTPHSRGAMRPSFARQCPSITEGAGNAGCPMHPQPRVRSLSEAHERSHHRFRRINRHSPRNGFNGLFRALPGDEFVLSPSSAD